MIELGKIIVVFVGVLLAALFLSIFISILSDIENPHHIDDFETLSQNQNWWWF